ncbi:ABC transporter permease [Aureimonas frigidaquae]|uniref:ABC-type nitrate/sulfonate/bicarbonate transport system, permease component n=1 Tax=Aureimonas frigidaquae TaxID=424757 RepID=A0A0P0Z3D4_9HYPH|nr:ABC transporter permease [Aureimonas frigidaquae]BAT28611.1 ABC-type nitrate/sulfonate/bicarbonate transport system, permease component [Aureimonas frigidaquae]
MTQAENEAILRGTGDDRPARSIDWRRFGWHLLPWLLPLGLVLLWHWASTTGELSRNVLPGPLEVVQVAGALIEREQLQHHILVSLRRVALGFALGASVGLALGIVVGLSTTARQLGDLTIQMVRTVPHLALVPLMIFWFGIGEEPRILLVALGVVFSVYINTVAGIRSVDPRLVEMGRSYGLSRAQLVWSVILPGALQQILTGIRYGLGVAWLTLVVAETIASREGLGFLVQDARELLRLDVIVLAILIYALAGWLADLLTRRLEARLLKWHPSYGAGAKAR